MLLFEKKIFKGRWKKIMVIVIQEECTVKGNKKTHKSASRLVNNL